MSRKYTKEEIIKCVEGSKTPSECLLKLGVAPIGGNPDNNVDSNLMLLCPNCHAKTDNYKSKNRQINKKTYACSECGKVLNSASMTGLCITCLRKSLKNPVRPSKEELEELLKTNSKTALCKKFGVSGRTILK